MAIRITIRGVEASLKKLRDLPGRMRLALVRAMQESTILVQSLAKINAPVFRGLLRVSILQAVTDEGTKIVGSVGSALVYAPVVEFGRSTGWFPPVRELKVWARRKLGDESAAFPIARAIKRRGFRKQPYLTPALEGASSRIELIFQTRLEEAVRAEGGF